MLRSDRCQSPASRGDGAAWDARYSATASSSVKTIRSRPRTPARGDRWTMDPEDGKIYKAEIWVEDGKLKVRGYLGVFYKTQTWLRAA